MFLLYTPGQRMLRSPQETPEGPGLGQTRQRGAAAELDGPGSGARRSSERSGPTAERFPFQPRLTLVGEAALIEHEEGDREEITALAVLEFAYDAGVVRPAGAEEDLEDLDLDDFGSPAPEVERDARAEARACRLLEGLGAVDLTAVTGVLPSYDSKANYLIALAGQRHIGCSFAAHGVAELQKHGFSVTVAPSFPFRVASPDAPLYGHIDTDGQLDWFRIELGVVIDGRPYNLVPALLELLEQAGEGSTLGSLAHSATRFRAVPLSDGRFVVMPWERLELILSVLAELYPEGAKAGQTLDLPVARVLELEGLDQALDGPNSEGLWLKGGEWIDRARSLCKGPTWSPKPAALRAELRSYQEEGLSWMEHLRDAGAGGILADDMGLGKTLQTISLLCREKEARRMDRPSLIVAPTSLVHNWQKELTKFAPHLRVFLHTGPRRHQKADQFDRAEVVITSYPIAIRDLVGLSGREYHYLILDEAQAIKNDKSLASTSVRMLSARHRLALSGTPVENHLGELWALMEFAQPGLLGRSDEFRRQFRDPIEKRRDEMRLEQLQKRVAPFILRRKKEQVATELPPKTELVRTVELDGDQRDLYESIRLAADSEVRCAINERGLSASRIAILDALMKLRQVCCDPRIVSVEGARRVKRSAKYDLFFDLMEAELSEKRKVLVFSQFTAMLGLLSKGLETRDVPHFVLTGQTKERQVLVDRFEAGETQVFLISLKAGGTGLNLVSAETVIHYDPWWNAAAQAQATDRAYRIGQKRPVIAYNLVARSSVEERILALQARKRHLADAILGAGAGGYDWSADEVSDLLSPLDADDLL
jgi:superfamily II DNA or RNA helicase